MTLTEEEVAMVVVALDLTVRELREGYAAATRLGIANAALLECADKMTALAEKIRAT